MSSQLINKELKIVLQKEINSYLLYSLPLCIILAEDKLKEWFYENYILIASITYDHGHLGFRFIDGVSSFGDNNYHQDIIQISSFSHKSLEKVTDINDYVCNKINFGFYLIVFADEYYLPQMGTYLKKHFVHDSLIYGYDDIKGKFKAIAFDNNDNFTKLEYDYDCFREAFENGKIHCKSIPGDDYKTEKAIIEISINKILDYQFDCSVFAGKIKKYLDAVNVDPIKVYLNSEKRDFQICYGLNIYDMFISHIEKFNFYEPSFGYPDIHFLYEHKLNIYKRLLFIEKKFSISEKFDALIENYYKIITELGILRNKFLKLRIKKTTEVINTDETNTFIKTMNEVLEYTREKEKSTLEEIYDLLHGRQAPLLKRQ